MQNDERVNVRILRVGAASIVAAIALGIGVSGASATTTVATPGADVSRAGSVYETLMTGTSVGTEISTESFKVEPGGGTVGRTYETDSPTGIFSPAAAWGASYAKSSETAYLFYKGKAKAAGNVYNGKRITKVCIWFNQGGFKRSKTVCSSATSSGSRWSPGKEVSVSMVDNLSVNWPQTTFNIRTTRISPTIY